MNFTAESEGDVVNLDWTTSSEINNDYFTIEKSRDANEFVPVQIVDGAGNSSINLHYSSVDSNPYSGISYYRLKQTDYDGKISYSEKVPVKFESGKENFVIYPNPATEDIALVFFNQKALATSVRILDMKGRTVYSDRVETHKGMNKLALDLPVLESGVYVVYLENEFKSVKQRLVIN